MITGMRKTDQLMAEPYATYLASFRAALYATNRWLLMGYGGADTHVNQLLLTALDHHRRRTQPMVVVVNHDDSSFAGDEFWRKARQVLPWSCDLSPLLHLPREQFVSLEDGISVSFDGTGWAVGRGLPRLREQLGL
jgi:hypothetical protein